MSVKQNLLSALEEHRGEDISGQELADRLCVSRAAVWKAIKALESEGYGIDAVPGRGYRLRPDSDRLSAEGIRLYLPPEYASCAVEAVQEIDSTNRLAKQQALGPGPERCLLAANYQTAGKGRLQKSFFSPVDTGLYFSLTLRRTLPYANFVPVTMAAAVAVVRVLERLTAARPRIKWVNDILVDGKKAAGILTEAIGDLESGLVHAVVIGIGLNLRTPADAFPPELKELAASIFPPASVTRNQLAGELAGEIFRLADALFGPDGGACLTALAGEYRDKSAVLGREITWEQGGRRFAGTALDIDQTGALLVRTPEGQRILRAGEISIRPAPPEGV